MNRMILEEKLNDLYLLLEDNETELQLERYRLEEDMEEEEIEEELYELLLEIDEIKDRINNIESILN